MTREGSLGDWFLARNSGRKLREIDPFGSDVTSEGKPLRACTSLHLRPEARATRKTVLRVRNFREISRIGSCGARRRACYKVYRDTLWKLYYTIMENWTKSPHWAI